MKLAVLLISQSRGYEDAMDQLYGETSGGSTSLGEALFGVVVLVVACSIVGWIWEQVNKDE